MVWKPTFIRFSSSKPGVWVSMGYATCSCSPEPTSCKHVIQSMSAVLSLEQTTLPLHYSRLHYIAARLNCIMLR